MMCIVCVLIVLVPNALQPFPYTYSAPCPSAFRHIPEVQNDLLLTEHRGLRESLATKKKRNKHRKKLATHREGSYHGGAKWWSPKRINEALKRKEKRKATEEQERLGKARIRELKAYNALINKKLEGER
jgi:hypothetical protein